MNQIMNENLKRGYEKPATKKHDAMNTVQGSQGYYNLYYTNLYYASLYYVSLYYRY